MRSQRPAPVGILESNRGFMEQDGVMNRAMCIHVHPCASCIACVAVLYIATRMVHMLCVVCCHAMSTRPCSERTSSATWNTQHHDRLLKGACVAKVTGGVIYECNSAQSPVHCTLHTLHSPPIVSPTVQCMYILCSMPPLPSHWPRNTGHGDNPGFALASSAPI